MWYLNISNGPGSPASPFASTAERDEMMPAGIPLRKCYMLNPYNPIANGVPGVVEFVDNGAAWVLPPQTQVLANFRNFDGSPILDRTAAALSVGTVAELWASPVLPDWMFDSVISLFAEVGRRDSSSTALARLFIGIRATTLPDSVYNNMLGNNSACDTIYRGCSALGNWARCVSGVLRGMEGSSQSAIGGQDFTIGSYSDGLTKARIAFAPGALTNQIRAYSIVIKSGVC